MEHPTGFKSEVLQALEAYFGAIEAQKAPEPSQRPSLRVHFEKLDGLLASCPPDADPQLRHFLERKSYEKALAMLKL